VWILAFVWILQWRSVQVLTNPLLEHPAGRHREIVIFAFA
jgi:hypothetical protein